MFLHRRYNLTELYTILSPTKVLIKFGNVCKMFSDSAGGVLKLQDLNSLDYLQQGFCQHTEHKLTFEY